MLSLHQHYYTIVRLSSALKAKLEGATLTDAYTLSKEELVLCFNTTSGVFVLRMIVRFRHCFLFFTEEEPRKVSNAQSLFENCIQKKILKVVQHPYNRSFAMELEGGEKLVFKMYDGLANVLLFENDKVEDCFREDINNDWLLKEEDLLNVKPEIKEELKRGEAVDGNFYIYKNPQTDLPYCLLLSAENGELIYETADVVDAYNQFSRLNLSYLYFAAQKHAVLSSLKDQVKHLEKLAAKTSASLQALQNEISPEEIGHIIMANLHVIAPMQVNITLHDFYRDKEIEIKLKKELNPQQNAEYYYRKNRNRKIEIEQLEMKINNAQKRLDDLSSAINRVASVDDMKGLKPFIKEKQQEEKEQVPFKVFEKDGFIVWVGKSASNNDLLTMKYAHKNDLWLHAKDVAGSHVVVRHKAGQPYLKQVLEYAAGLAAYYSKAKGNSLVPVAYVLRKGVRKPKGSEPGQVMLDKEEVILIEPKKPD